MILIALLKNFNTFVLDEFFLIEFFKCQYRASLAWSRTCLDINSEEPKPKKHWVKKYVPYGESLYYEIMKKSSYLMISEMLKGKEITFEKFKGMVSVVTEKEITSNKRRFDKGHEHYTSVRRKVASKTEEVFEMIMPFDFENCFDTFVKVKLDLKNYLETRKSQIAGPFQDTIPSFEWRGIPYFKIEVIGFKKSSTMTYDIIMMSPIKIDEKMKHRNFFIAMVIRYFNMFYSKDEEFLKHFSTEKPAIDRVIIYNPTDCTRNEVRPSDINMIFQEADMFRMLYAIINSACGKTVNVENCHVCEQNTLCYNRSGTKKPSYQRDLGRKTIKNILEE